MNASSPVYVKQEGGMTPGLAGAASRQAIPPQPTSLPAQIDSANHWLVAYVKAVSPFSSTKFTIQDVSELQRIITADTLKLCTVDAKVLCKAFIECTMVAHGMLLTVICA
jgi:hypothetical protein